MTSQPLGLFAGFGVEIEYMIVAGPTLSVSPVADALLMQEHGSYGDVTRGEMGWSNEMVLHVVELKTAGPAPALAPLAAQFAGEVRYINAALAEQGGRLMPSAMHPLMDPATETRLWPHEQSEVYAAFDRIFGCRGHGWSNLQSTHLNLPFCGDEEFGRLHAAIRLALPLLPALSASSPLVEGRAGGGPNGRLGFYRSNAIQIPSLTGQIIPEPAFTRKAYETNILARIYQDLAEDDPGGVLQHEWANARGAIARFDRSAIEIRLLDVQECPAVDIAVVALVVAVLRQLVGERHCSLAEQQAWSSGPLVRILRDCIAYADEAVITDEAYLRALGWTGAPGIAAGDLWRHLIAGAWPPADAAGDAWRQALAPYCERGPLARRVLRGLGKRVTREGIVATYAALCDCLADNRPFR